jgi:hypothetical protein
LQLPFLLRVSLLLRTLLFFAAASGFVASITLTVLFPSLLLLDALLVLILPNALLILFPARSLLFLVLVDTLAVLFPALSLFVLILIDALTVLLPSILLALLLLRTLI